MHSWKVKDYAVYQFAPASGTAPGFIHLYAEDSAHSLRMHFTQEVPVPNYNIVHGTYATVWFSFEQFLPMLDMLRNEEAVYAHVESARNVSIGTRPRLADEGLLSDLDSSRSA